jgi:hypothetical protein
VGVGVGWQPAKARWARPAGRGRCHGCGGRCAARLATAARRRRGGAKSLAPGRWLAPGGRWRTCRRICCRGMQGRRRRGKCRLQAGQAGRGLAGLDAVCFEQAVGKGGPRSQILAAAVLRGSATVKGALACWAPRPPTRDATAAAANASPAAAAAAAAGVPRPAGAVGRRHHRPATAAEHVDPGDVALGCGDPKVLTHNGAGVLHELVAHLNLSIRKVGAGKGGGRAWECRQSSHARRTHRLGCLVPGPRSTGRLCFSSHPWPGAPSPQPPPPVSPSRLPTPPPSYPRRAAPRGSLQ